MSVTAIILCRYNSSRLRGKHFKKIGDKYLINHTIDHLKKINFINEIYIATGKKSKNYIFKKKLKSIYKNLKFFFHKNEDKVVERIYCISKKIKNKKILIISGDCPIIDNIFLKNIYSKFNKKNYDFSIANIKLQHEGILLTKKKIWSTVNLNCKNSKLQEHPSLYLKKNKNKFNFMNIPFKKRDLHKGFRMSVDTESDLDFFNINYLNCKNKNINFNYDNLIKNNKYSYLNSHVKQKNENFDQSKKIIIITLKNKKFGLGHYKRALVIKREILERLSIVPKIFLLNKKKDINKLKKELNLKKDDNKRLYIFDIPKKYLIYFQNIKTFNKKIIIDNFTKNQSDIPIIPSIRKIKNVNSIGPKYLILNRKIIFDYLKWKMQKNKYIYDLVIITGGTFQISKKLLLDVIKLNKKKKIIFILGPFVSNKNKNLLKKNNLKYISDPKNYFNIILSSKNVISRFGNSVNEVIYLKKKPWIYFYKDGEERKKNINYLFKLGLASKYNFEKIINSKTVNYIKKPKKMFLGGKNVIPKIKYCYKRI